MFEEKTVLGLSANGFHRIHCTVWGKGKDTPVVCVHGLTRNGRDFDKLAAKLAMTHTVYCPDMAGRGQSDDLADPFSYNLSQYMADCNAIIARIGSPVIDWVGTSMGGMIGMMLAAQKNSPIRRLVLNDAGPAIAQPSLIRIGAYLNGEQPTFANEAELEAHMRKIYAPFGVPTDEDWHHMASVGWRKKGDGRLVMAYDPRIADTFSAATKDLNLWDAYDRIKCPTLVLRGETSDILKEEVAQEMTKRGPKAKLETIKGAGHAPPLMSEDQIKLIQDFLWDES